MENSSTPVVILCGGKGTRMGLVEGYPKCLVNVAGHTLLWYVLHHFRSFGFRRFVLPLGFGGDKIRQWLSNCRDFDDCDFVLLETGLNTPVTQRLELVLPRLNADDIFFLANSDTICRFDLISALRHHRGSKKSVTLMTMPIHSPWGLILRHNGEVVAFERESLIEKIEVSSEAGTYLGSINSGFAIINRRALQAELEWMLTTNLDSYEPDFYGSIAKQGELNAISMSEFWMAFDTKKDLISAESTPNALAINRIITLYTSQERQAVNRAD